MYRWLIITLLSVTSSFLYAGDVTLPTIPNGVHVFHGKFNGQPFWFRLQAPNKQFGENRVCELVYSPPTTASFNQTHISDCPLLLVDNAARIVAWNGRDIGTKAVPAAPSGYSVTREYFEGEGEKRLIKLDTATIPGGTGWDLHIAPILLALTWKADSTGAVRVVDLFGTRQKESLAASWNGTTATIADVQYTITVDKDGKLAALTAPDATKTLEITTRE